MSLNSLIANVLSALCMVIIGISAYSKTKEYYILQSILSTSFNITALFLINSMSGVIMNAIALVAVILIHKGLFKKWYYWIVVSASIVLTIVLNTNGLLGYVPLCAYLPYLAVLISTKNMQYIRLSIVYNLTLWLIYDLSVELFTAAILDAILVVTTIIALIIRKGVKECTK